MDNAHSDKTVIFLLRMAMAWTFLYAASHQVFVSNFSIVGFLGSTKTFHGFFQIFTGPIVAPMISFLVAYGHLLIGLSLLTGLLVRVSSIFGIGLMLIYWMAHMNYPYISDTNNFLVDEHIVYAIVLGLLVVRHAGQIWGLDAWAAHHINASKYPLLGWALA